MGVASSCSSDLALSLEICGGHGPKKKKKKKKRKKKEKCLDVKEIILSLFADGIFV